MQNVINKTAKFDRRTFLRTTSAYGAMAAMPLILGMSAAAAQGSSTMVIAAPATPQSLDCEFDVSLGTFEAVAALYDGLVAFEQIADAGVPEARREDIAYSPEKEGALNVVGKLATSWEIDPSGSDE